MNVEASAKLASAEAAHQAETEELNKKHSAQTAEMTAKHEAAVNQLEREAEEQKQLHAAEVDTLKRMMPVFRRIRRSMKH